MSTQLQALSLSPSLPPSISLCSYHYSNGHLDPWSGGGVLKSISDSLVAIVIKDGAHHLDLRASNPADPDDVIAARKLERQYIEQWIKDYAN